MLRERLLSSYSRIELRKVREDDLSEGERNTIATTRSYLASYPFTIESMRSPSLSDVVALIKKIHKEGKADIVFIDYLRLIKAEEKDTIKELKTLAEKLSIAVIVLHQIPRGSGEVNIDSPFIDNFYCLKRKDRKASLIDMKENKDIELAYDPETTRFRFER